MKYEILDELGAVVNTIVADQAFVENQHPGRWRLVEEEPPAPEPIVLSPLAFARLLLPMERIGIRGNTHPAVIDFLWMLDKAQEISLSDPDTIAGVGFMVSLGLLTADRAAQVLAGTPPA